MFIKRHLKNISVYILCAALFALIVNPMQTFAGTTLEAVPQINAESAIVYSVDTGEKLVSFKSSDKYYPIGVAKIMTAIIAVENAEKSAENMPKSSEKVTVGKEILTLPDGYTSAGFKVGDVVSLPDLITAAIVSNADDAAIVIGVYIGRKKLGGVSNYKYNYDKDALEYFVSLMNRKIQLIGLTQTTFTNCTGHEGETLSHTTAADVARISAEFVSYKFLRDIAAKYSVKYWDFDENQTENMNVNENVQNDTEDAGEEIPEEPEETPDPIEQARNSRWTSINQLMNPESVYYYKYCQGITANKTADGRIYISAYAEYHDIRVVAVVMDADPETVYDDIIKLFDYVFNNYVMYTFVEDGQQVAEYFVKNAMDPSNEHLRVCAKSGGKYLSRIDKLDLFGFEIRLDNKYYTPTEADLYDLYISPSGGITKGDVLGTMDIYYNTKYIDTVAIYAGNTVSAFENLPRISEKKWYQNVDWSNAFLIVFVLFLLICIFILFVSITNKVKKQKRAKQRYALKHIQKKPALHYSKKKR